MIINNRKVNWIYRKAENKLKIKSVWTRCRHRISIENARRTVEICWVGG